MLCHETTYSLNSPDFIRQFNWLKWSLRTLGQPTQIGIPFSLFKENEQEKHAFWDLPIWAH